MTTFPGSPRLTKSGLVIIDPATAAVLRVISFQYNPDSLTRTLQVQAAAGPGGGARSEALRLKGPPVETFKLEVELDATDQLEFPEQHQDAAQLGLYPQLAALETLVYPPSDMVLANNRLARAGTLEITPAQSPLTLFIWSKNRILPVRVTEFSITEEAFDPLLNPIRARVSLGMRVLNVNDLGFSHQGGNLFMLHHQQKERLAALLKGGSLDALGIGGIL